jgi:rsbT antagonist protein RsbS
MNDSQLINYNFFEVENCLIIPIEFDLYDDLLNQLKIFILEKLKKLNILGTIIDISAIKIIDSFNLKYFIQLKKMVNLMGKEMVIVGVQPGVASALTELQTPELNKLLTFMDVQKAIQYLQNYKMAI